MGGKQWRQWPKAQGADRNAAWAPESSKPPPWRLWPGAYTASPKATRLHYDQVVVPGYKMPGKQALGAEEEESADFQLRKEVQKALSLARKADLRVRKLREEKQLREAQWLQYQKEARTAFLQEKARFQTAVERLDQEIQQTTTNGKEASAMIQTLVARGPAALPTPAAETEADSGWAELTREEDANMEAGFLRDAMMAARRVSSQQEGPVAPTDGRMVPPEIAAQLLQAVMANLPLPQPHPQQVEPPPMDPAHATAKAAPPLSGQVVPDVPYNRRLCQARIHRHRHHPGRTSVSSQRLARRSKEHRFIPCTRARERLPSSPTSSKQKDMPCDPLELLVFL